MSVIGFQQDAVGYGEKLVDGIHDADAVPFHFPDVSGDAFVAGRNDGGTVRIGCHHFEFTHERIVRITVQQFRKSRGVGGIQADDADPFHRLRREGRRNGQGGEQE